MSGNRFLLLFLSDGVAPPHGWLRIEDGVVVDRGRGDVAVPPPAEGGSERIVAVLPGPDVVFHWVGLPSLSPPQALAAARLMASEVAADPLDRLHVALGAPDEEGTRVMALVSAERMALWLAQAQTLGLDPDMVLPETLLLPGGGNGIYRWERDGLHLLRGPGVALAAEPELAVLASEGPVTELDDAAVEAGLAAAIEAVPVDLRQGAFAKRRRWRIDWPLLRRLAMLGGCLLLTVLLIQLVLIFKYGLAADQLERDLDTVARRALPRGERISNPSVQLAERLAELRGGGLGYTATASALFAAVRDSANVELSALQFDRDGSLRVTATAAAPAEIAAFQQRLQDRGFAVDAGDIRLGGGRQIAELTVRAR